MAISVIRAALLLPLCLLLAVVARAEEPAAARDPAQWGVLGQLAGANWSDKYLNYRWRWGPDNSLLESGSGFPTATIVQGERPGTLVQYYTPRHTYDGYIGEDGSVLWIRRGVLKMPMRIRLDGDELVMEKVKLDDANRVVRVTRETRYRRTNGGAAAASGVAVAGAASVPTPAVPGIPASVSPVATPAAAVAVAPAASFGWLDNYVGRSLVGSTPYGGAYTLDIRREGDALVMDRGMRGGTRSLGRIVLRPGPVAGGFELVEMWDDRAGGNRSAYFAGSAAEPATSPLDGLSCCDPRDPGDLVIGYDIPGGYHVFVFHGNVDTGGLSYQTRGGTRRFGIRGNAGNLDYVASGWFSPATQETIARTESYSRSEQQRQERERREEAQERSEQQSRKQAALYDSLVRANEVAAVNEARSRAALDATLEQAARQGAAYEGQQRAGGTHSAQDVQNAREATKRQYEIARQYEAQQQAQQQAAARRGAATSSAGHAAAGQASTRERADGCVGQPMTSTHQCGTGRAGLKGRVVNSCAAPVDVRMCFMTDKGWSCQSEYGVDPESAWEPGDCSATGQVFRSVRYSDSNEPLASP